MKDKVKVFSLSQYVPEALKLVQDVGVGLIRETISELGISREQWLKL